MQLFALGTHKLAMRRLYQNFKLIGLTVLPTEQLKVSKFVSPTCLKNGLSQLNNFLYSTQKLFNLDLISF
ncbi:hypothetical protein O3M35_001667 [Rhynocoris fuscipes]|uniref:Uncharacterized protein n=1 Tax=Rhynocoris fuscipes TaxID=488301 RepID=A0AAW1CQU3_9HEMI